MENQITSGQKISVLKLCKNFTSDRECRLYILSAILGRQIFSANNLKLDDWKEIRDLAYDNWEDDDWDVSDKFYQLGNRLSMRYQEEVLGQGVLFDE